MRISFFKRLFFLIILVCLLIPQQTPLIYASNLIQDSSSRVTANAMAVEGEYVYIVGQAVNLSEQLPAGSLNLSGGMEDIWLVKLHKDGTPVYQAIIGGAQSDFGFGISVYQGVAYIIGETWSTDFPGAPGNAGESDSVLFAVAADGSSILWARRLGGSDQDSGRAIAVEGNSLYLTGITWSKDFISGQAKGDADGFIGRMGLDGSLQWLKIFGGNLLDAPHDIAVDSNSIWIAGQTFSFNFGGIPLGGGDAFLTRHNLDGDQQFTGLYGGSGEDMAFGIKINNATLYLTGGTQSNSLPNATGTLSGGFDAFLMQINANGEVLSSTYFGGSNNDYGYAIANLPNDEIMVIGNTFSPVFPIGFSPPNNSLGAEDAFWVKVNNEGSITNAKLIGGSDADRAIAIELVSEGAWLAGKFSNGILPYGYFISADQFTTDPLPIQSPIIPTATLAPTATFQPTETPNVSATNLPEQINPTNTTETISSTETPFDQNTNNNEEITISPAISTSPVEEIYTEVNQKTLTTPSQSDTENSDNLNGLLILFGLIILAMLMGLGFWIKRTR